MTKSAECIQFEEGFLKAAADHGCDVTFLRGYIKEADEIVAMWKEAFDELEQQYNDPQYKTKIASEIIRMTMMPELRKQAGIMDSINQAGGGMESAMQGFGNSIGLSGPGGLQEKLQGWLGKSPGFMSQIGEYLKQNPNMLNSILTGGAGGGLAGLLMGSLVNHPMAGLMLGGLGGAGGAAYMGNHNMRDSINHFISPQTQLAPHTGTEASTPVGPKIPPMQATPKPDLMKPTGMQVASAAPHSAAPGMNKLPS